MSEPFLSISGLTGGEMRGRARDHLALVAPRPRRVLLLWCISAPARLTAPQKKLPSRGGWFRPSCELKMCTPATRSAWASGHFSGQTAGSSARFVAARTRQPSCSCLRAARARRSFVWARRHCKHVGTKLFSAPTEAPLKGGVDDPVLVSVQMCA
jgi:hypothetical protein